MFGASFFLASQAFAGCYFVACPNNAPQPKPAPTAYAPQPIYIQNDDNYDKGYEDGLRASKPKIVYVKSKSSIKKTAHKKPVYKKQAVKKAKKTYRSYAVKSHSYKHTNTYNYLPMKDRAYTYNAAQYGQSVHVAGLMGRGEQWHSSKTTIVRYNRPYSVQITNGQACGWASPINQNGANSAWVCQCAQGWLPPR